MSTSRFLPPFCLVACAVLSGMAAAPAAAASPARSDARFAKGRVLVRLERTLDAGLGRPDGALRTGDRDLDALVADLEVTRIRSALPVSTGSPVKRKTPERLALERTYVFELPPEGDVLDATKRLAALPGVVYAEPDWILAVDATIPDDPLFGDQWGLHQPSDADVDAPEAWDISRGGSLISVLDTGIDTDHQEFADRIVPGHDFVNGDTDPEDDHDHGSSVSSILGASGDNGAGLAGICWHCSLMPVKVMDADGTSVTSIVADGYVWATDNGARIINHSGSSLFDSQTLHDAVRYAYDAGVIVVATAGNYSMGQLTFPGRYPETIAVGATDTTDRLALFSDWGTEMDIVAPGETTPVAVIGGYSSGYGTSLAAPLVSGLLGIMRSGSSSLGREEARHLVCAGAEDQVSTDPRDTPGFDEYYGWGRLNLERTLLATRASASLRAEGNEETVLSLIVDNPLADSYDFVRGDLSSLSETSAGVSLGVVNCLENDSPDAGTAGSADPETPIPGAGFFYVARFSVAPPGVGAGSYGGSSRGRDRSAVSGDCAE